MNTIIIILFNFTAGVICLICGVNMMSDGLEKSSLKLLKKLLSLFTGNVFSAFLTGALVTAIVQSSTAVTVITVGFVNSGLIKLSQAVGIIYGANLGTTITAQLMSFNMMHIAIPVLAAGILVRLVSKKHAFINISHILMGFGLMFSGIGILNLGVPYIRESKHIYQLFIQFGNNPYMALVIGAIATMLVHSSSATVGLTIVLFNSGLISFEAAVGLTLGDNIGTCVTAQLASLKTNINARRTAWAHTLYNTIGVFSVLIFFSPFTALVIHLTHLIGQDSSRLIANVHTIFNMLSAAVFIPVSKHYISFIEWIIPERK